MASTRPYAALALAALLAAACGSSSATTPSGSQGTTTPSASSPGPVSVTPVTGVCATVLHNVTVVEGIVAAVQGGSLNPITAEAELAQGQQDFVNESQAGGASLRSPLEGLVSAIGEYRDAINQNRSLANSTAQIDQAVAGVKSACG